MVTEKEMQEKYMVYQYLEQQMKQVQQQLQNIDQQLVELEGVKKALADLKEVPINADILVPVASGIFVKAKLLEHEDLLVNVGDNVSVKKKYPEAQALLEKQGIELMNFRHNLLEALQKLSGQAELVEQTLQKMVKEHEESNV